MRRTPKLYALLVGASIVVLTCGKTSADAEVDPGSARASVASQVTIDVYEAVLGSWLGPEDSPIFVDENLADAPTLSNRELSDCLAGVAFNPEKVPAPLVSLQGAKFTRRGIHIVDGKAWKADDTTLNSAVAQGQFHESDLRRAFAHALTSFSRIQFDESRRLALVKFSYKCGALCGSGSTLLLRKVGSRWKVLRRCGGWVS